MSEKKKGWFDYTPKEREKMYNEQPIPKTVNMVWKATKHLYKDKR